MKFKIKYADQIVGFFSLLGLVGLIVLFFSSFVIFRLHILAKILL